MSQAFVRTLVVVSMMASVGAGSAARPQAPTPVKASADAIRLNNLGVASMNQQKFEAALKYFEDAAGADPSLRVARTNQAIAQLALQHFDPARTLLESAVKEQADDARAWYNLGLLQKSLGDAEASLAAFTRAAELRPRDPHAHYFAGLLGSQLQQYDTAVTQFQRALELDPFLVSAEFGLARAFQRAGKTDDARTHMERFTRLTQIEGGVGHEPRLWRPGTAVAGGGGPAAAVRDACDPGDVRRRGRASRDGRHSQPQPETVRACA